MAPENPRLARSAGIPDKADVAGDIAAKRLAAGFASPTPTERAPRTGTLAWAVREVHQDPSQGRVAGLIREFPELSSQAMTLKHEAFQVRRQRDDFRQDEIGGNR